VGSINHKQPPQEVLDAFELKEKPSRLEGGEGRAYASGDVVLKPIALPDEAVWIAQTLSQVAEHGFRVERPVKTIKGDWLFENWSAWQRVEGDHDNQGRWGEVLRVTEAFHCSLEQLPRPDFLDVRDTQWDAGDRAAWGEDEGRVSDPIGPMVEELRAKLGPVDLPNQVIHGDMPRNVLFAEGLPPAVIDFSPYYRPAGFASAIVVVDALTWYGANESILRLVKHIPEIHQLLLRATIYRLFTTATASAGNTDRLKREVEANRPTIDLLDDFARRSVA
jgi:uncharacterized protein (TIGR02569 family)